MHRQPPTHAQREKDIVRINEGFLKRGVMQDPLWEAIMALGMVRNMKAISFNSKMENNTDIHCWGNPWSNLL